MNLTEVLIALVIISVALIPVAGYFNISFQIAHDSKSVLKANHLAEKEIVEVMKNEEIAPREYSKNRHEVESKILNDEIIQVRVSWEAGNYEREHYIYGYLPSDTY